MGEEPSEQPRRRRGRGPRRAWSLGTVGSVLLVVVVAGLTARDGLANRSDLEAARAELEAARSALGDGDVATATTRLETSADLIADAEARTRRPWWWLSSKVPLAGRSLGVAAAVGDVAREAVAVGRAAVEHAAPLLGDGDDLDVRSPDGAIDLTQIADLERMLEELDPAPLADALDRLEATQATWVPEQVRTGRRDALRLGTDTLEMLRSGDALVDALPGFLGADGPRHYFLAMQNPAELRGTGGLIGLWSILTIDEGRFEVSEAEVYGAIDLEGREDDGDLPPVPTSPEFADRYDHVNAAGFFASVNVDPDLPTTGPVLADLFEDRFDMPIDGVIALDPVGLAQLLELADPVQVPADLVVEGLPATVRPEELPQLTLVDLYHSFVEDQAPRKAYLKALAEASFDAIFAGDWDAIAMARRVGAVAGQRHLQLYSAHAEEQAAFELAGVAGGMESTPTGGDLLAFTGINAAGNKADVHVAHRLSGEFALSAAGQRTGTLRVDIENPLPTEGPAYIVGSLTPVSKGFGPRGPDGLTRTWVTLWTPETTHLAGARTDDGEPLTVGTGVIHGHRAFDHHLEVRSDSTGGFEVDIRGPVEMRRDGPDLVYGLTLWRQAKAIPDHVDLEIAAPEGWDVAEVRLTGGGTGKGMGVGGDGTPLQASRHGSTVRISGAMTQDAHLEVRYTRGLWDRFTEWLSSPAF